MKIVAQNTIIIVAIDNTSVASLAINFLGNRKIGTYLGLCEGGPRPILKSEKVQKRLYRRTIKYL